MNRRQFFIGGTAALTMAAITNLKGHGEEAQGEPETSPHAITYLADGRIESIGQERGNRWLHMKFDTESPVYRGSYLYTLKYGVCEPLERLHVSWMPIGTPSHETVEQYNKRVIEFFDWSFTEYGYAEEQGKLFISKSEFSRSKLDSPITGKYGTYFESRYHDGTLMSLIHYAGHSKYMLLSQEPTGTYPEYELRRTNTRDKQIMTKKTLVVHGSPQLIDQVLITEFERFISMEQSDQGLVWTDEVSP